MQISKLNFKIESFSSPGMIILAGILAYGMMIPWLGIYWDEMFFMMVAKLQGTTGLVASMSLDRPLLGELWALQYQMFGDNLLLWHLLALSLRIASGLTTYYLLKLIWPDRRFLALSCGILFTVYPGFLQQPMAFMYQLTFTVLVLIGISFISTVQAARAKHAKAYLLWTLLSILSLIPSLLLIEYFLGLELLRLSIILFLVREKHLGKRLVLSIKRAIPYFVVYGIFLIWRVLIFVPSREGLDATQVAGSFLRDPLRRSANLALTGVVDFLEASIFAWFSPAHGLLSQTGTVALAGSVILGTLTILFVGLYAKRLLNTDTAGDVLSGRISPFIIGMIAFPGAIAFILLSGRDIRLQHLFDRYSLAALLPVVFIVVGAVQLIVRSGARSWILAILVGLAVATHLVNADTYRKTWERTIDMWWQISWRIPQLEENSMLGSVDVW